MTNDERLRDFIRSMVLPKAPTTLHERLRSVAATEPGADRARARTWPRQRLLLAVAVLAIVGSSIVIFVAGARPAVPATVDGLPVMTVSEALAAHAEGLLPGGRAAIRGWWSNGSSGHSCVPSTEKVGELELRCHDGEYGISEQDEQMFVVNIDSGVVTYEAQGAHLSPFFSSDLAGIDDLFGLPRINGQQYPPVPITVVGHFDDPRAAECGPQAQQLCLDRLVLERIVAFDLAAVPTPGVTPSPTPFPDPPPPGLFKAASCAGDVPYSFTGWTATSELHMQFERPGLVYAMVTEDVVLLTEDGWADDPNGSGHRFQIWGRKVCISKDAETMEFGWVEGSTYVLWDDGLKVPGANPLRP